MKSFLQFLKRAYKYFCATKRVWRKPPQADLLIIDRGTASPLDEMFAHHNPHVLDIRGESVNMLALFRALPKIRLGAVGYLEAYIDFVKPKLILSRTDNNATMWQLKRRKNLGYQVALVQNGWRFPGTENSKVIGTKNSDKADVYFSAGSATPLAFSLTSAQNFSEIGSLNLNEFKRVCGSDIGKNGIFLVSNFRSKIDFKTQGLNEFGGLESAVLKREVPISIISQSIGDSDRRLEINFFETAMPNVRKNFLLRHERLSSYRWLLDENIIINDLSTLGYEALALGLRVGFISLQRGNRSTARFGLPLEFGEKGPFWTNDPSEEEIGRILDYLLTVSDEQWERDSGWIRDQLMAHDYGNTKIRAYVESVLADSLENAKVTNI